MSEKERSPKTDDAESLASGPSISRRSLCLGIGGVAVTLAMGGLKAVPAQAVVRPPGGQDEDLMEAACVRCQRCLEVCPRSVIKPAHIEDGIVGMRMPQMNFSSNYCDFCQEENDGVPKCVQACPSGALVLPEDAQPETTYIGVAKIVEDWCLAYNLTGCRYCYDACPYEAINLDEFDRPVVDEDACNGCGACEAACVSLTEGSISVGATSRAITVHPLGE
jgi:ferredoxin-type protein NapG